MPILNMIKMLFLRTLLLSKIKEQNASTDHFDANQMITYLNKNYTVTPYI